MGGDLDCADRDGTTVVTAAVSSMSDTKNPYSTSNNAVRGTDSASHDADGDEGYVNLVADGDTITVTTCWQDSTDGTNTFCTAEENADIVENTVEIGG